MPIPPERFPTSKTTSTSTGAKGIPKQPSGHNVFVSILAQLIGVSVIAIIADSSENAGKLAVALMLGWLVVFLMINAQTLNQWTGYL